LLLLDLKELGDADAALRSVSGYDMASWERLWHAHLAKLPAPEGPEIGPSLADDDPRMLARAVRLGELLYGRGEAGHAAARFEQALAADKSSPSLRWRAGRALIGDGRPEEARSLFERLDEVGSGHAGWFALRGRFLKAEGQGAESERAFALGIALNPFLEDAACEGILRAPGALLGAQPPPAPAGPRRALCEAARKMPQD
jgi:tetratricopeptide (TPR) repeat protein